MFIQHKKEATYLQCSGLEKNVDVKDTTIKYILKVGKTVKILLFSCKINEYSRAAYKLKIKNEAVQFLFSNSTISGTLP